MSKSSPDERESWPFPPFPSLMAPAESKYLLQRCHSMEKKLPSCRHRSFTARKFSCKNFDYFYQFTRPLIYSFVACCAAAVNQRKVFSESDADAAFNQISLALMHLLVHLLVLICITAVLFSCRQVDPTTPFCSMIGRPWTNNDFSVFQENCFQMSRVSTVNKWLNYGRI